MASSSEKIKILFLAASPAQTEFLDLATEADRIQDRLREAGRNDAFDLEQEWRVRLDELPRILLEHKPDIVHFSGHGSEASELLFEDMAGRADAGKQEPLADLFRILKGDIQLVVLNACYSEAQARQILPHTDCVIGTSAAIGDEAAIDFAGGLYRGIAFEQPIQTAFDLGRNEIAQQAVFDKDGHLVPQLLAREGIDPKTFIIGGGADMSTDDSQSGTTQRSEGDDSPNIIAGGDVHFRSGGMRDASSAPGETKNTAIWVAVIGAVAAVVAALIAAGFFGGSGSDTTQPNSPVDIRGNVTNEGDGATQVIGDGNTIIQTSGDREEQ